MSCKKNRTPSYYYEMSQELGRLTASAVVGWPGMFGVPAPALPLSPVDKMEHLRFRIIKRFGEVVVIAAVDPELQQLVQFHFELKVPGPITSRDELSSSFRRKRTKLLEVYHDCIDSFTSILIVIDQ